MGGSALTQRFHIHKLTALIFFHCRSNSAFSLVSLKRRVFRPSDILMPYWKAALQTHHHHHHQSEHNLTWPNWENRGCVTLAAPPCCSCSRCTPLECQSPSGPEDPSYYPANTHTREHAWPETLGHITTHQTYSCLVHLAVVHFFIAVHSQVVHPARQSSINIIISEGVVHFRVIISWSFTLPHLR